MRKKMDVDIYEELSKLVDTHVKHYKEDFDLDQRLIMQAAKSELPEDYFVLTLGLSAPLESDRVAAKTEPYPGRWTTHFVISSPSDLDEKLFDWIELAYGFAQGK